jgi:hypothetical protein
MGRMEIVCYGAGTEFTCIKDKFDRSRTRIVAVLDRNVGKSWTSSAGNGVTKHPRFIRDLAFDYVLLCSSLYHDEMRESLLGYDVSPEKIILANRHARGFDRLGFDSAFPEGRGNRDRDRDFAI